MKVLFILLLSVMIMFGSLYQKPIELDLSIKEYVDLNIHMIDTDISKYDLTNYVRQGFLVPDQKSWIYIIDYHQAAIIAIEAKDYQSAERVWKGLSEKYDDSVAQYNLGRIYELQLLSNGDMEQSISWYKKAVDKGYEPAIDVLESLQQQKATDIWNITEIPEVGVVYTTYGSTSYENQFGFLKPLGACNIDYIWLSFLGSDLDASDENTLARFDIEIEDEKMYLDINATKVYRLENGNNVVIFSYVYADEEMIHSIGRVKAIQINSNIPEDFTKKFYAPKGVFSMLKLEDSRAEAYRRCEVLSLELDQTIDYEYSNESNISQAETISVKRTQITGWDFSSKWILYISLILILGIIVFGFKRD